MPLQLVLLGGDIRFAAHHLVPDWDESALTKLSVKRLEKLSNKVIEEGEDGVVNELGATFVEAKTLGPALLAQTLFARHFELDHIFVSGTNLRDGLLADIEQGGSWTSEFRQQIVRSAVSLGRKYGVDQSHARAVAELARKLFEQLLDEHQLDSRYEVLLYVAALVHEMGLYVNLHSNHKHAYYSDSP